MRPPAVGALEAPGTPGSAAAASAAVVAALMHWYTEPDLLRLVIAQCLDDDPDAVAFSRAMAGAFSARLESLLRAVCGEAAPLAARAISSCAAGVLIDAMIEHGAEFPAFAASAAFHESLDSIARLILDAWVEA